MNKRSQRGAARVPAVWMIVVVVLFFVSLAFGFVSSQDLEAALSREANAVAAREEALANYDKELSKSLEISKALGFYNREVVGSVTEVDEASKGLDSLRNGIVMPESVTDFEQVIQPILDTVIAKDAEMGNLQTQVANLQGRVTSAEQANRDISQELQAKLNEASQRYNDLEQQAGDEKTRLENDVAQLRSTVNQLNADLVAQKGVNDDVVAKSERDASASATQAAALNRQLKIMKENPAADGQVLAVSKGLGLGWINRGATDRVSRGMIFEVRSGNSATAGEVGTKGWAEVTEVEENRSQVRIYNEADRYDPVSARDVIFNPIFDPGGERYAVMIGRFSGSYNAAEVKQLLEEIGITVQNSLDLTTNYLIVGGPLFVDEEGEPSEDPIQPSELPLYKDAQAQGVYTISINDLRQYFKK